jgi:plastocyanin
MPRPIRMLAVFAALALTLAGCASGKGTGLTSGPTEEPESKVCSTIDMNDALKFVPEECTAAVGQTVVWKNIGSLPHTVTSEETKFDSTLAKPINAGQEYSFTFKTAGSYPYYCALHATKGARSGMIGTITVEAGTTSPSP